MTYRLGLEQGPTLATAVIPDAAGQIAGSLRAERRLTGGWPTPTEARLSGVYPGVYHAEAPPRRPVGRVRLLGPARPSVHPAGQPLPTGRLGRLTVDEALPPTLTAPARADPAGS